MNWLQIEDVQKRFAFEDRRLAAGLPIKGKAFFDALNEELKDNAT